MSQGKSINSKNLWYIITYIIINASAFLLINNLNYLRGIEFKLSDPTKWLKTGPWALGLQLVALLLCYMIPVEFKDVLVFWRFRHPLPGCRAFSFYAKRDPRIDLKAMIRKLKKIPTDPDEQNRVWYSLFLQIENEIVILDVHRWYLLFRDLTSISILLMPVLVVATFTLSSGFVAWAYMLFLFVVSISLSLAARNAGKRFVCTVLARTSWK